MSEPIGEFRRIFRGHRFALLGLRKRRDLYDAIYQGNNRAGLRLSGDRRFFHSTELITTYGERRHPEMYICEEIEYALEHMRLNGCVPTSLWGSGAVLARLRGELGLDSLPTTIYGLPMAEDPTTPDNVIELRFRDGTAHGKWRLWV